MRKQAGHYFAQRLRSLTRLLARWAEQVDEVLTLLMRQGRSRPRLGLTPLIPGLRPRLAWRIGGAAYWQWSSAQVWQRLARCLRAWAAPNQCAVC